MKFYLLILALVAPCCIAYCDDGSQHFIKRAYRDKILLFAGLAEQAGKDPILEGETPEERQFLRAYYEVKREELAKKSHYNYNHILMESLRRCGVSFPEGTTVLYIPVDPPLHIIQTKEGLTKIEKLMGLKRYK